mgnify:CR=1 FL=1
MVLNETFTCTKIDKLNVADYSHVISQHLFDNYGPVLGLEERMKEHKIISTDGHQITISSLLVTLHFRASLY